MNTKSILLCFQALVLAATNAVAAGLGTAHENLVNGREYKNDMHLRTRDALIEGFFDKNAPAELRSAIAEAVAIRNDDVTVEEFDAAKYIAWEGLEALLYGYLSAGERDLLKGVRMAFPSLGDDPLMEERAAPIGVLDSVSEEDFGEIWDDSLQSLYYAHLFFGEALQDAVGFMQTDPAGRMRAVDVSSATGGTTLPFFTKWAIYLEELEASAADNLQSDTRDQWSLTGATLLGKVVRRYGGTAVSIADKLWRKAYFHPGRLNDREALLNEASDYLRCHSHAQFLASLPLAATLEDGQSFGVDANGDALTGLNEYQETGSDGVRSNITAAQILARRIAAGERPRHIDLVPRWDPAQVNLQIGKVTGARSAVEAAWLDAERAINDNRQANVGEISDRLLRRDRYKFRLWQITGIHPDDDPAFENLESENGRNAYLEFVEDWVLEKTENFNPADEWFAASNGRDPLNSSTVSQVSDLGLAALRMMQAFNELKVAQARIDAIPQQIAIEGVRNSAVNEIVDRQGKRLVALDIAVALAKRFEVAQCACGLGSGVSVTFNGAAVVEAAQAAVRNLINTSATVGINNANSRATIENLLVELGILVEQLPSSSIQAQLASNEVRRLYAEAERLVEDLEYHQSSSESFWYNDPELVFEQERAEQRYQKLVGVYQFELYKLAKMLEKAWVEDYQNPPLNNEGGYATDGNSLVQDPTFEPFPDAEGIFAVSSHELATDYFRALKAWNDYLVSSRTRGPEEQSGGPGTDPFEISLRQHILGLSDLKVTGTAGSLRFTTDSALRNENTRRFRNYIRRLKDRSDADYPAAQGVELRLDFPINLNQQIKIADLGFDESRSDAPFENKFYIFAPAGVTNFEVWNRRAIGFGLELIGHNVTQGQLGNEESTFNYNVYLHGTVTREAKQLDSLYIFSNKKEPPTNLELYQFDPLEPSVGGSSALYKAVQLVGVANGSTLNVNDPDQLRPISWPFACDNWVVEIKSGGQIFNWENIDDIVLHIRYAAGPPVTVANNYNWPPGL